MDNQSVPINPDTERKDANPRPLKREKAEVAKKEKITYDDPLLKAFAEFRDEIDENVSSLIRKSQRISPQRRTQGQNLLLPTFVLHFQILKNDRRERLIKTSRDVTSLSKKLIFLLHRFKPDDLKSSSILKQSKVKLDEIVKILNEMGKTEGLEPPRKLDPVVESKQILEAEPDETEASGEKDGSDKKRKREDGDDEDSKESGRFWKYERYIGPGIEEFVSANDSDKPECLLEQYRLTRSLFNSSIFIPFLAPLAPLFSSFKIEGVSFYHFLSHGTLITYSEIQALFRSDSSATEFNVWITPSRYVLGLSDLSGEIMRFSTNNAGGKMGGREVIEVTLGFLRELSNGK